LLELGEKHREPLADHQGEAMEIHEKLPQEILSWRLSGQGLEKFGTGGKPDLVPFPRYGEEDLIARVDACGLCFSDIKLISSGNTHPRILGRDLTANPTVPGHEVSMTVVGVGERWKGKFSPGSRYIIQADVFYRGKSTAFGYVIPGGLSQYVVIGPEVLDGDEGCYLIPVHPGTGYAEAALVEPWTCVIAAYQIAARTEPRQDAVLLLRGFPRGQVPLDLGGFESRKIAKIIHRGLSAENLQGVERMARACGAPVEAEAPGGAGPAPSDIVCAGTPEREEFSRLVDSLDANGVIGLHTSEPDVMLSLDVGKVHYRNIALVGSLNGAVLSSYAANTRETLVAGGKAWFVGGAGPMGQMHVIKAACDAKGPGLILVTDHSEERLESLKHLVSLISQSCGRQVSITFMNSKDLNGDDLDTFVGREFPGGFDDIVVLVPLAAVISQVSAYLAPCGVLNIFAGVKIGTIAEIPLAEVVRGRSRITGSSGSPLSAMKDTLALVESKKLSTALSLAAVGDMFAASRGMKALMDGTYTGKVVIFPFARGIGLKSVKELARDLPEMGRLLLDGEYWTNEAEAFFLKSRHFAAG
jgi:threonine dehydrogenase-like Zn-dependent dehydrogenase